MAARALAGLLVALAAAGCAALSPEDRFAAYVESHVPELVNSGKSSSEWWTRRAIFESNAKIVDSLNAESPTAVFSLDGSPFSHLTQEEFASRMPRMSNKDEPGAAVAAAPLDVAPMPASFDWRKSPFNAVTSVKNQGALGSCWAFSSVGNIEGQRAVKSNGSILEDLSVEQLIECDATTGPRYGKDGGEVEGDCGEFGGWPYLAYQWWKTAGGVRTDKEMPYCSGLDYGAAGFCSPCMARYVSLPPPLCLPSTLTPLVCPQL